MASASQDTAFSPDTVLYRNDLLATTELDGEVIMLCPDRGVYFSLDATGSRIWHLLAQPTSYDDLCKHLLRDYQVEAERCHRDVQAFLQALWAQQLVSTTSL